ncbi:hypothetical protein PIB30_098999 [Stylosanthes scabra]|uniref:Uncharacterized protein n=1 Tax=Stylosanthes scabra TaxID=79078 RepID=A0ABU6XXG3_9FABA|nr:hypothetical protein [Stylosanthes scabra]
MAPCDRAVPSCVRTYPWERFGKKSAQTRATRATLMHPRKYKVKAAYFVDRALARAKPPLRAQLDLYDEGTAEAQGHSLPLGSFYNFKIVLERFLGEFSISLTCSLSS